MTSGHYGNFPATKNHPIQTIVFKSYISFKSFLKVFEKGLIGGALNKKPSVSEQVAFFFQYVLRLYYLLSENQPFLYRNNNLALKRRKESEIQILASDPRELKSSL